MGSEASYYGYLNIVEVIIHSNFQLLSEWCVGLFYSVRSLLVNVSLLNDSLCSDFCRTTK